MSKFREKECLMYILLVVLTTSSTYIKKNRPARSRPQGSKACPKCCVVSSEAEAVVVVAEDSAAEAVN